MPVVLDFEGVDEFGGNWKVLEPGIYDAKTTKAEIKGPGPSGHKYVNLTYDVGGTWVWECTR